MYGGFSIAMFEYRFRFFLQKRLGRRRSVSPGGAPCGFSADWIAWISAVLFVLAETAVVNIILMLAVASNWKNQGVWFEPGNLLGLKNTAMVQAIE
jgi:hypothetical protein